MNTHHSRIHNRLRHELAEEAELGLDAGEVRGARVAAHGLREQAARPRHVRGVRRGRRDRRLLLQLGRLRRALLVEA